MEFKAIFPTAVASSSVMFSDTKVSSKLDLGIVTVCRWPTDGTKAGCPVDHPSMVQWGSVSHHAQRDGTVVTILAVPGLYFGTMFSRLHRQLVVIIGRRIDNFWEGREIHKQQEVYLVNKIDERMRATLKHVRNEISPSFMYESWASDVSYPRSSGPDKVDDYMVLIVELDMGASCGCPAESLTAKGRGSPLPTVLGKGLQSPGVQELV
ncbi:hypothetical protein B0H14DRAFT_2615613 [Mycena olivaceomarginata]|nr:hypothetical protein B0H14DRAFT_2615613 [Mycena olivaceomarginata]